MARLRLHPERVLSASERGKRFRARRRGEPVPEAPRVMTAGRALAEAMEGAGEPLATAADFPMMTTAEVFAGAQAPAVESAATAKPAAPVRFDAEALIG
jgi:hypothetical protein